MSKSPKTIHTAAAVLFEMTVINPDGSVARRLKKKRNLLLDSGLNQLKDYSWTQLFSCFALGTASNPTSRDSGLITVTVAGGTATASAGFFDPTDVGRLLKADSGEERTIAAYTSPTVVTVAGADVAASQFTVWYVNDTALGAQAQVFSLLSGDTGDHGWNWNGATHVLTTWVTRVSNAVTLPNQTFKEIGWALNNYDGLVNGRALINGGIGDTLVTGQKYKVKVTLERTVTPVVARACPMVTNWAGTAQELMENIDLSYWDASGLDAAANSGGAEPSSLGQCYIYTGSVAFRGPVFPPDGGANPPPAGQLQAGVVTRRAYAANSFYRDFDLFWDAGISTSTAIRSIVYGYLYGGGFCCMRMLTDTDEAKTSADKLTITLRKSWGRILVNQ